MTIEIYRPTLADLRAEAQLTGAEQALLDGCKTGEPVWLGYVPPDEETDGNTIRAGLIRYLMLGGCAEVRPHPHGVQVAGAFVRDVLDLQACKTSLGLAVVASRFLDKPDLRDAELGRVIFEGTILPGLNAQRMTVHRNLSLSNKFESNGLVDVTGSKIGGQLNCRDGRFDGQGSAALMAQGLDVSDNTVFGNGFTANGTVDLAGSKIGGQLSCSDGRFEGQGGRALNLEAVHVGSDVFLTDGLAVEGGISLIRFQVSGHVFFLSSDLRGRLSANGMQVGGTFFWRNMTGAVPMFNLDDAKLGKLDDDRQSWNIVDKLYLNGLTYDDLGPSMSQQDRLDWLGKNVTLSEKGDKGQKLPSFNPQPYSQLASVWDRHGRRNSAAQVLFERERRVRASHYLRSYALLNGDVGVAFRNVKDDFVHNVVDRFFGAVFGYGYRPMRAVLWSVGLIVVASLFYGTIYERGQMAPAAPVIMASAEWRQAVAEGCPVTQAPGYRAAMDAGCEMPLSLWEGRSNGVPAQAAADYESFDAVLYGADVFIPLVGLGQETAWSPSRDRGAWGWWGFYTRWVFQALGWIITALGAATLTGLVGRRD